MLLVRLIDIYSLIIVAVVLISWIDVPRSHPAVRLLRTVTEPVLAPVRRILPPVGGMDFSPVVVLVGLRLVAGIF